MPYIGRAATNTGNVRYLDNIASGFDGSDTTFTAQVGGVSITPDQENVRIYLDGVFQHPGSGNAYTISGSTITFTEAPVANTVFSAYVVGAGSYLDDKAVSSAKLDDDAVTAAKLDDDGTGFQVGDLGVGGSLTSGDKLTVTGRARVSGGIIGDLTGDVTGDVTGNTSGTAATVTGGTQASITSAANLVTVGTIGTGVWQGTPITSAYLNASQTNITSVGTLGSLTVSGQTRVGGAGSGSSENLLVTSATSSDHTRVHIEKTANAGSAGVSLNSYTPSASWTIYQGDDSDGDLIFYDDSDSVLTLATDNSATFAGNLIMNGSSSRQIEFKDGSTSEGAIVFDEITNGLVFKVGGTSGSSKLDALKITSGGEFTMTSGSDMILNLVSTATNGKEYEIQSTDAGNLTFVRRTGSAAEILRFTGSDDSATFDGDILGNTAGSFRLINGQGSASSPSYAFHSDTNTGMFRAANGVLGFTTFGTERLRITGTGDIWHNNGNTVEHALAGHTNELNISHHWNSGQATIHFCYRMENTYTDFTFYNGSGSGHPDLNAASFDTTSDYRMKKSVTNFTDNVCDKIKLLRPITYNWKANTNMTEARQIGFLAHELQEQLPLAVKGEKDAMSEKDETLIAPQSIKGEALSSYMMKALQEIITRLEALENA